MDNWYEEMEQAEQEYDAMQYELARSYEEGYQQGRADSEKEDLIKACIKQLKESDADEVKVSADTKDGYKVTVIVELKEQTE